MKNKSESISLKLDGETLKKIEAISIASHKSKSFVVREFIDKGLKADGYKNDDERLYQFLNTTLKEIVDPAVNRLAAISAKNSYFSGAEFIMLNYLAKLIVGENNHHLVDDMSEKARVLGIELLKAKDDKFNDILKKICI